MDAPTVQVVFTPSGRRGRIEPGTTVLDAARGLGVDVDSVCGGRGLCGRCQVTLGSSASEGIDSGGQRLSLPEAQELGYKGRRPLRAGHRLACAARLQDDAVIDVPPYSQVRRQVVRKRAEVVDIPVDPVVRLHYLEVAPPDMHRQASDLSRVLEALDRQWGIAGVKVDHHVLQGLQEALRAGQWAVTVAVHDGDTVTGVWPGFHDGPLGVAIDVGSTTVAGHLCDLSTGAVLASSGVMNPQIRYGEDLMSRVSYVMMNDQGQEVLTSAIRATLDEMVGDLVEQVGRTRDSVLEVALVGNPIMHHLVLGLSPYHLGVAPFALATDRAVRTTASKIGVEAHPGARLYVLPCVAGHVGADAAGAILSEGPHRSRAIQLLVDVGTNAEIVLGSAGRLLAASSPTGPAFEGAEISSGQRAAPGAIERIRIDRVTLEPRFKVIGVDLWSDEEGFEDAVAATGVIGICGSGIIEAVAELVLSGVVSTEGLIQDGGRTERVVADGRSAAYLLYEGPPGRGSRIMITQNDVRAIQLAKAALQAGVRLLMDRLGVDRVDEIRLAGAFGSHTDPIYAMVLGMIPDCDPDRVSAAGNAAGAGAMMALLSGSARSEIEALVGKVEKIETAVAPGFQRHFVEAMGIPHATVAYEHLGRKVDLSGIVSSGPASGGRRGRTRRRASRAAARRTEALVGWRREEDR